MSGAVGLILGSGFDCADTEIQVDDVDTRFGQPSSPVYRHSFADRHVLTILRHGPRHSLAPHVVNYRANVQALADLGTAAIVAVNTVGLVTALCEPGQIAVPNQIIDYTWGRAHTIFDSDAAALAHIEFTEPFTPSLRVALLDAARNAGVDCLDGGVYAVTQGPRLETAAEINRVEAEGADFVGMTAMPEAAIARELGLDYACLALAVNRAAGRGEAPIHEDVAANIRTARELAVRTLERFFAAIVERTS